MSLWRRRLGYIIRAIVGAAALWLIWMVWRPVYFTLSEDLAQPVSESELAALVPGTAFLLSGTVEPVAPSKLQWQGRFVYLHRERKDVRDGSDFRQLVVDVAQHRPALSFNWNGKPLVLRAESYGIEFGPRVARRVWPRKWLGLKRVDDWHQTSTGFRAGEAACAYGRVNAGGQPQIEELMPWPLREVVARIGDENRLRSWLTTGFKIALTLGCLVCALPRWKGSMVDQKHLV